MKVSRTQLLIWLGIALTISVPTATAAVLILSANEEVRDSHQKADEAAKAYSDHADVAKERRCGELTPPERYKCLIEEETAANQGRHDAYDLEAQQISATWTRYTGLAAVLGTAFGVLGITLVLLTLWENRRAANAAEESLIQSDKVTRAQLRAYFISIEEKFLADETFENVTVTYRFKNVGQTPANDLAFTSSYTFHEHNAAVPILSFGEPQTLHYGLVGPQSEHIETAVIGFTAEQVQAFKSGNAKMCVSINIEYLDEFGDRWQYNQSLFADEHSAGLESLFSQRCETRKLPN